MGVCCDTRCPLVKRKPYKEGDWFAVPVDNPGYVLGRIARVGRRGGILLGYFFEPLRDQLPTPQDVAHLTPEDAFNIGKFGDRGLVEDDWPIIHRPEHWSRADWPMPMFGRIGSFEGERGFRVRYDENELSLCMGTWPTTIEQALQMPSDGLAGHIFLQRSLAKYFRGGYGAYNPTDRRHGHIWFHGLPRADTG